MNSYKINTILVPVDFSVTSDNVLKQSIDIAKSIGANLIVIHVVEMSAFTVPTEVITLERIANQWVSESNEKLKGIALKIREEHGIEINHHVFLGSVYENIIRSAHLMNADLIILGTHGFSGIKDWLFGSNAYIVVNNTTIPVLTINLKSDSSTFKKIVFPFNENLFTIKKVSEVIILAKLFKASVLLVGFTKSESPIIALALRKMGDNLTKQFADENIPSSFSIALGEDYAQEIMNFADKSKADIITVATNKHHNVDKILESKPYRKLVNLSTIPVLTIPVE